MVNVLNILFFQKFSEKAESLTKNTTVLYLANYTT